MFPKGNYTKLDSINHLHTEKKYCLINLMGYDKKIDITKVQKLLQLISNLTGSYNHREFFKIKHDGTYKYVEAGAGLGSSFFFLFFLRGILRRELVAFFPRTND